LAGAILIACAHLVVSAASAPASDVAARPRTPRRLIEAPAQARKDATPRTVAAVIPGLQSIPIPGLNTPNHRTANSKAVDAMPATIDSTPEPAPVDTAAIQPAPDAGQIPATVPSGAQSLAPQVVDSSGKKALKQILRTIGGTPAADPKAAKR
jgi:hypothetical protein